jgi:hypothetical protein
MSRHVGRRARTGFILVVAALALASCGGGGSTPQAGGTSPDPSVPPAGTGGTPTLGPSPSGSNGSGSPAGSSGATPNYLDPTSSPAPYEPPWTPEVPVDAIVTPSCVRPGTGATVTVQTAPKAGIAYHAMYAGSRGGAPKPVGSGYGGNDKGMTDGEGRYTSSWIVSPQAPPGPARLDVIVGTAEDKWGYDDPPFWVADASGRC